jgi:hypothetical protein
VKRWFYKVSFLMVLAQVACLALIFCGGVRSGMVTFQHLSQIWIASAVAGLACAIVGDGVSRQPSVSVSTVSTGAVGIVLNAGFLLLLGVLHMALWMHRD